MNLAPREIDKRLVYVVADLARKRQGRGLKLNYSEAVALITEAILEAARDGRSVADCMELGPSGRLRGRHHAGCTGDARAAAGRGVLHDGTKLVSCHDPSAAEPWPTTTTAVRSPCAATKPLRRGAARPRRSRRPRRHGRARADPRPGPAAALGRAGLRRPDDPGGGTQNLSRTPHARCAPCRPHRPTGPCSPNRSAPTAI
ncbi:urease subunit gamma [Streptomyces sp. CYG21]|nr:urease subunit gamma [Streptomyces sp. CYG21]